MVSQAGLKPELREVEEVVEQLREIRKHLVEHFDHDGWTITRCEAIERLDRALELLSS